MQGEQEEWVIEARAPEPATQAALDGLDAFLLVCAAVAVIAVTAVRLPTVVSNASGLNHVSGVWITQAEDLADGVFYRPLLSERGYGGTRYMPLHFVLHATLIQAGASPIAAGYILTLFAAALLTAGVYVLMRRLGVGRAVAAPGCLLWLALMPSQFAATTIRGDLIAAAANVRGVAFAATALRTRRRLPVYVAALLFMVAFAAKVTMVFGLGASVLAMLLVGRRRTPMLLAGLSLAGMLLVVALTEAASGGRWLAAMRFGLSGGAGLASFATGPLRFVKHAVDEDPFGAAMWALALTLVVGRGFKAAREMPTLLFLVTGLGVVTLFASPGTDFNHLIDLDVAAIVYLAVAAEDVTVPIPRAASALALLAALGAAHSYVYFAPKDRVRHRANLDAVVRDTEAGRDTLPLFSDSALVPVSGRRAAVPHGPLHVQPRPAEKRGIRARLQRALRAQALSRDGLSQGRPVRPRMVEGVRGDVLRERLPQDARRELPPRRAPRRLLRLPPAHRADRGSGRDDGGRASGGRAFEAHAIERGSSKPSSTATSGRSLYLPA